VSTGRSSRRCPASARAPALLLLAVFASPSVAGAIPPPELAAAVVSDLLILVGAGASAAFAWFFAVRRDDPDGPARRAWRQLGGVVALSLLVTGALVARHRAIDRERLRAPLFRDVGALPLPDDARLPPAAVSPAALRALLQRPDPPLLVDIRPGGGHSDVAPALDAQVPTRVLRTTYGALREDPSALEGLDPAPVLICWTGETSAALARELTDDGVPTRYLAGGLTFAIDDVTSLRVRYEDQEWLRTPRETAELLASGHRAVAAGEVPHAGHAIEGAVALSALAMPAEVLRSKIAALPRDQPWIGLCWDRRSCYDAELLGAWMTDAGLTWRGRATAPDEVGHWLARPRRRMEGAALTLAGVVLFLLGGLRRRGPPDPRSPRLVEATDGAGAKAATLGRLRRAGVPVPPGLVVHVDDALPDPDALAAFGPRLAVRSSALDEDGDTVSAAGRYLSLLDVAPEDVGAAIARVRASMGRGAVLVQPMVVMEAGGVLFTRAPGAPGFMEVEWAERADAVTAGGDVRRARLSRIDGAVLDGALPPGVDGEALASVAWWVEELLGGPQDIEWGFAADGPVVLQSRPITAMPHPGPVEEERRRVLDTVPRPAEATSVRWRQQRVCEALPRPTPLELDLLRAIWSADGAIGRAHAALGLPVPATLEPLDGAPRLQPVFGVLTVVMPEPIGQAGPTTLSQQRLDRALERALALQGRDRPDLSPLPLAEHAAQLLSWWDALVADDHLPLALVALGLAARGAGADLPAIEGRARRSLVDLRPGPTPHVPPRPPTRSSLADLLALRESVRAEVQAATEPLRRALVSLDARLGLDGRIRWLHRDELLDAVTDPGPLRDLAAARERAWLGARRPFLPAALSPRDVELLGRPVDRDAGGGRWLTPPVTVSGRARVLGSPDELGALEPGEILVAPIAEVGWVAAMDRAAALVVQVGGALSHLAIVARERGVPVLAGVEGLDAVETGAPLTLGPDGLGTAAGGSGGGEP